MTNPRALIEVISSILMFYALAASGSLPIAAVPLLYQVFVAVGFVMYSILAGVLFWAGVESLLTNRKAKKGIEVIVKFH